MGIAAHRRGRAQTMDRDELARLAHPRRPARGLWPRPPGSVVMRLEPGEHLVRFAALTPANLGSAYGEATLDRPTRKEARFGLPYLPDSALKGVLAGALGDEGEAREALFGSADRDATDTQPGRFGEPSPVIFGNGELLAFPVPVVGGAPAWVFPALHLA